MMKRISSIVFLLMLAANIAFAQTPVKQSLVDIATLDFPEQPNEKNVAGVGKMFRLVKPTQSYNALVINIDTAKSVIKTRQDLDLFYSGVVDGAADSTERRKLLYVKQIIVGKYRAVEFKFLDTSTPRKFTVYARAVYLDSNLFMYNFTVYDDTIAGLDAERERFLNSFTITKTTAKQL